MSKEKSPAFQFYPRDWLSDPNVASMSYEQEGWYIHLVCHCWLEGRIPADPNAALRLVGIRQKDISSCDPSELLDRLNARQNDMSELLEMCFEAQLENGEAQLQFLVHPRIEKERKLQEERRAERVESGKKGGKASVITRLKNPSSAWKELQANSSSSSSSSSSINNKERGAKKLRLPKSHTVPADFVVTKEMREALNGERPDVDIDFETKKFRDHEFKDAHSNWAGAWRNWIRNAKGGVNGNKPKPDTIGAGPEPVAPPDPERIRQIEEAAGKSRAKYLALMEGKTT
jgi:uncharacterized protein YdaU (DUF1376 family)